VFYPLKIIRLGCIRGTPNNKIATGQTKYQNRGKQSNIKLKIYLGWFFDVDVEIISFTLQTQSTAARE